MRYFADRPSFLLSRISNSRPVRLTLPTSPFLHLSLEISRPYDLCQFAANQRLLTRYMHPIFPYLPTVPPPVGELRVHREPEQSDRLKLLLFLPLLFSLQYMVLSLRGPFVPMHLIPPSTSALALS